MANITNEQSKSITLRNIIKVDNIPVRHQEVRIATDDPENMTINAYYATSENTMELYKANRTAIRQAENEFEDLCFTEQEKIIKETLEG